MASTWVDVTARFGLSSWRLSQDPVWWRVMSNFEQALTRAEAQCQQHRAAYVAALTPEALERIRRNEGKPRPTGRRITIEREPASVVRSSQCPYVGITTITSKKNGRL